MLGLLSGIAYCQFYNAVPGDFVRSLEVEGPRTLQLKVGAGSGLRQLRVTAGWA
jgi:hypothetical protein